MRVINEDSFTKIIYKDYDGQEVIHLGPWIGEFGYEICSWIPHVRFVRQLNPNAHIVVSGDAGHHPLYDGLADEYWVMPQLSGNRHCEWRTECPEIGTKGEQGPVLQHLLASLKPAGKVRTVWPTYIHEHEKIYSLIKPTERGRKLADRLNIPDNFIIIFPRLRLQPPYNERNYPHWSKLVKELKDKIPVVISGRHEDTQDINDIPWTLNLMYLVNPFDELDVTMALLEKAQAIVGINSGAILMSLYMGFRPLVVAPIGSADMLHIKPLYVGDGTYNTDPVRLAAEILSKLKS